ncbi:tRNA epoxyqueuosine(34) reductase QueG [Clostridium botulinum]|uniref:tRNA epoxyqueuosine(34) reductase QueG n=1 Tax=Clostridium botulinum TaxID=1491 RepID=UPI00052D03C5|nr:tRNA epoxyqueuosine(34) reductase QueG [Clostridium botulinum]KGM93427.1 (Fe-S)-binding protein [Clostridium botulinum D str. CCUG 7971]KOC46903.1 (Fe-S)-binding protein [Clostridium botulinum]NFO98899.1 tRNA epoxyqueuosine(34) reductase QueG [Clostridium botulinum]OOV51206.1 epoxyqueuosine reductase [Clostridium botulinum D/C]OOV53753.1 epoxyqueuosine reductase [Clostridium botulinum D/C]
MNCKEKIIEYCNELELDLVRFTKCRVFTELKKYYSKRKELGFENEFEENDIDKRINPFIYMEKGKTIISIAFPYLYEQINHSKIYFSKYTLGSDYHEVVSSYLEKICEFIKTLGGEASHFVDSNCLPERYIAYLSGVGFVGKNNMLITEKYGSYIFLGEIITDLELEEDYPIKKDCGECELCLKACPTGAISNDMNNNSNICLSYITQKKDIDDYWLSKFKGRMFGCDTCQNVCPYNRDVINSNIQEFKPFDFMEKINPEEILNMSKKDFNSRYKLTSCGWRGKNIIQRNMLINMFYFNDIDIKKVKEFSSPYVQSYYNKLLKFLKL